jgi:tripartite-type tricarboxylate transporter receptor subunit TctC
MPHAVTDDGVKLYCNETGRKTIQERKTAGCRQTVPLAIMISGAILGVILLIGIMASPLCAQTYPTKPVRFIMPMAPGGVTGIVGRIVSQKLTEQLGQPVVTEYRSGAGGNVGYEFVALARPDGYTIVLGSGGLVTSPSIYKKLNYDPIKDLAPVSLTANVPAIVLVHPSRPFKNLKELVEYAKANPGKLHFGSSGIGSANHLTGELLRSLAKIDIVHVPYKGAGPALIGLMGGEIDIMMTAFSSALPQIKTGKFRALAMLSHARLPELPDVPTAKEAGIDHYEVSNWYGIIATAGTPRDIVNRLNAAWIRSAAMPDTQEMMQKAGVEPASSTPEQFAEFLKTEIVRWGKVIKDANISKID